MEQHQTGRIRRHIEERRIADATVLQNDPATFDVLVGMHSVLQKISEAVGQPRCRVLWSGTAQIDATGQWHHRIGVGAAAAAINNPNTSALTLVAGAGAPGGSAPGRGAGVWQVPASNQVAVNATGPTTEWTLYGTPGLLVTVQLFGDPITPALGGGGGPPASVSMGYLSGQTYGPQGVLGVQVLVPNDLSAMPFPVYGTHTFQGMGVWVTTAGVGTTCLLRLGAYRDAGGYPGALIGDFGTVDATSTGIKTVTGITLPASYEILWLAVKMEAAGLTSNPQVIGHTGNNAQTIFGVPGQKGSNPYIGASWTTNGGFGTPGFPATYPAIGDGVGQTFADEGSWAPYLIA